MSQCMIHSRYTFAFVYIYNKYVHTYVSDIEKSEILATLDIHTYICMNVYCFRN